MVLTTNSLSSLNNHIVSLDILTTSKSCASVNGFSVINGNHCVDNSTYHKNCYILFICKAMTSFTVIICSFILTYD